MNTRPHPKACPPLAKKKKLPWFSSYSLGERRWPPEVRKTEKGNGLQSWPGLVAAASVGDALAGTVEALAGALNAWHLDGGDVTALNLLEGTVERNLSMF